MSVAVIAAYLAFFPVAVGTLRGLQSPAATPGRADATPTPAAWWQTLVELRLPASVPYLLPALRLAAAAAVVGAIVAEISTGPTGGIGRLIIEYAQAATGDPPKLYTAIIGAAVLGLVAAGLVGLLDVGAAPYRPGRRPMSAEGTTVAEQTTSRSPSRGVSKVFDRRQGRIRSPRCDGHRPRRRARRVRLADRPVRLRQVHAAAARSPT